jgi:hypothetical protein
LKIRKQNCRKRSLLEIIENIVSWGMVLTTTFNNISGNIVKIEKILVFPLATTTLGNSAVTDR